MPKLEKFEARPRACERRIDSRWAWLAFAFALVVCCLSTPLEAQRRGGGGGRSFARSSVSQPRGGGYQGNRGGGRDFNDNRSFNDNRNYNQNVNVNRNVNVHNDVNVYHHGYYYDGWGHPVAAAAAVTATAIAVGTIVASLPPQCSTMVMGNVTYQNCGGTYYQPVYQGTTVQYVVVNPPQ
ncbi:MAG: hypothetical protein QM778_20070 [Myxococcales bacterium]